MSGTAVSLLPGGSSIVVGGITEPIGGFIGGPGSGASNGVATPTLSGNVITTTASKIGSGAGGGSPKTTIQKSGTQRRSIQLGMAMLIWIGVMNLGIFWGVYF